MSDPFARRLASVALAVALVALATGAWAVHLGYRYLGEVQELGQTLQGLLSRPEVPSYAPPPLTLDTGEE